jgi:hypothetical protein
MLDQALHEAHDQERITDEEWHGLRVLFALHVDYRGASPTTRKSTAASEMVEAWRDYPFPRTAKDEWTRAESFRRRHLESGLRLALRCLRETYGQDDEPPGPKYEALSIRRFYVVDRHHHIRFVRREQVIRVRTDDFSRFRWRETSFSKEGPTVMVPKALPSPDGTSVDLIEEDSPEEYPDTREIALQFGRNYSTGDLITCGWEEESAFDPTTFKDWNEFFVGVQSGSDNYALTVSVTFEGDLPAAIWWWVSDARGKPRLDPPEPGQVLTPDADGVVSHTWQSTERRVDYGVIWRWTQVATL